ncbi:hypothetical protein B0J18DRAFT_406183 [Chaetomium sp. MPI-SDFR-AT-0129]|nr:hypothetical protein B0J18DRAFT_406183 [Chaetomium sp. MPI-SDFR-AT-0129]
MQAERGATLAPAINANVWEQGMSSRLVLFRDWLGQSSDTPGAHLAALQKLNGKMVRGPIVGICAFRVTPNGLVAVEDEDGTQSRTLDSNPAQKRKLGETDFEVADSEDEEYGWDDDDELPPMPSQWQGSEDLLLTREPGRDSDDDDDEGDEDPSDTKHGDDQGPGDMESSSEGQIMIPPSDS